MHYIDEVYAVICQLMPHEAKKNKADDDYKPCSYTDSYGAIVSNHINILVI